MKKQHYHLEKNKTTKEMIDLKHEKINDGYQITPKTKQKDAISVSKIVFVSPSMTEKLIRIKIDHKVNTLLKQLKQIENMDDDDDNAGDVIRKSLVDAERLKLALIQTYIKYLGNTYQSLTLKKIQIIINQLRIKLYLLRDKEYDYDKLQFYDQKKGRGR